MKTVFREKKWYKWQEILEYVEIFEITAKNMQNFPSIFGFLSKSSRWELWALSHLLRPIVYVGIVSCAITSHLVFALAIKKAYNEFIRDEGSNQNVISSTDIPKRCNLTSEARTCDSNLKKAMIKGKGVKT
jgi:hypothetical protein